jgi:hypothetical protein
MTYRGVARGKTIELEEALPYPEGQSVTVSVEAMARDHLPGSPAAILEAMHDIPHLSAEDIDALERAIEQGRLPVRQGGIFDEP